MIVTRSRFQFVVMTLAMLAGVGALFAQTPSPFGNSAKGSSWDWQFLEEFSDEFDGSVVDAKKWNIDTEDFGVWSWEPENTYQKDGALHLQAVQETHQRDGNDLFYKSGIARTRGTTTYGYFEARVKGCDRYPGASPAFWLYSKGPQNRYIAKDGETVVYSEIDVIELQQSEYNFETKQRHEVNHIDCNLHASVLRNETRQWIRPTTNPELCKNEYDSPWDPREDYHVYAVENTKEWVIWYIDGKEIARKENLYWHLPMYVTLSLGMRYPFESYKGGERSAVPVATTKEGFPTTMSVDYVRVWRNGLVTDDEPQLSTAKPMTKKADTDMTQQEYVAMEKSKWAAQGWNWNLAKVESNFAEIDTNGDGIATGQERQKWFAKKFPSTK